ncbi:MAG: TonB-dependent receptor [Verrucomicrobia bacterium]|nr:MAG: TonB-dependent receptor [Verrucomicrobiota bacterium]
MTKRLHNRRTPIVCNLSALGLVCALGIADVTLAQDTNAPSQLKPVVVTGSLIPTAETVGATPVQTLSTEAIDNAGTADTLLTLRKLVPGFTGAGNYLGSANNNVNIGAGFQAFTGESYAAIRNLPTLVLIDGQRVVSSALSGGQAVDLNSIPLAMIERVEVLKDGASALYGSDAIGGVINIITKKNFTGVEISGRYGFPVEGPGNHAVERQVSIVMGTATENARFTAGAQLFQQEPLLTRDRSIGSLSAAELAAHNVVAAPAYFSPSFPGKVQAGGHIYLLANSPFLNPADSHYLGGGLQGYNPTISTPPVFPGQTFAGSTAIVDYNNYAISQGYVAPGFTPYNTPGPYVLADTAGAVLKTTDFGTTTILSQDRRQFWASGEYDIFKDKMTVYSRLLYSDNFAEGQLAPSPVPSQTTYNTIIPADNPYNPFGILVGQGQGTGTNAPPRVRSRFVDFGNRTFVSLSDTYQWVGGLKGNFSPDYAYDLSYDYSRSRQEQQTRNAVNGALLNQAFVPIGVTDGQGRPLSTLTDAAGNNLPVYNFFGASLSPGSGVNAQSTIDALKATLFTWGQSELWSAAGVFNGTPFSLPAGKVSFAAGGSYNEESISLQVDGLSQGNLAPGLNVAVPFPNSRRKTAAGFIEVNIPITSPDMKVPGFYDLSFDLAGRYQTFDPGGDAAVPKIGVRWQPINDQLTLRGSYNEGFIAPSIFNLFGPAFASNPNVVINGQPGQVQTEVVGNPNLQASNAKQYGAGIVITPKSLVKNLTLSVDYYNITEDHLPVSDAQSVANSLSTLGPASPFASGFTTQDGYPFTSASQVTIDNWLNATYPWQPAGALKTEGIDFSINYVIPDEKTGCGKITLNAVADLKLKYQVQQSPALPFVEYKGTYTPFSGSIPEWSLNTSLTWEYRNLTYVVNANYLPAMSDPGLLIGPYSEPTQGFSDLPPLGDPYTTDGTSLNAYPIPAHFTIDMQLNYEFGKTKTEGRKWYDGTKLTVGCLNITDEQPPVISDAVEDNTDKNVYDIVGQFVYFQVSKKF